MNAQIGLLLYDRHAYRSRCSGVLVEFLCAGVPVIVPSGTWLTRVTPGAPPSVFVPITRWLRNKATANCYWRYATSCWYGTNAFY